MINGAACPEASSGKFKQVQANFMTVIYSKVILNYTLTYHLLPPVLFVCQVQCSAQERVPAGDIKCHVI